MTWRTVLRWIWLRLCLGLQIVMAFIFTRAAIFETRERAIAAMLAVFFAMSVVVIADVIEQESE